MRRLRSPSDAARLRPHKVRTRVLRSKTLLWRDSFPPKDGKSGPHETGFMGQAILWKPSPWRKFPSKRGRPSLMSRLRSPSGAARLRPQVVRTRFCGAKPCFGGIHFRQRMVNRGPMKRVSWGRRYCGSLHHGGDSPVNGESGPWREVFGKHRPFYGQFAGGRGKP